MKNKTDKCDIDQTYAGDMSNINTQDKMDDLQTKLQQRLQDIQLNLNQDKTEK